MFCRNYIIEYFPNSDALHISNIQLKFKIIDSCVYNFMSPVKSNVFLINVKCIHLFNGIEIGTNNVINLKFVFQRS